MEGPSEEDFDLYVRYGQPVARKAGQYDAASYGISSDELVTIDDPKPGTYYVLVHSYKGSGSYTLEVELA